MLAPTRLCLTASVFATLGCARTREDPMRAAEKLNTLSQDLCIGGWLTEAQRKRLVQRAEAGAIREAAVDAYVDEVRDRIDQAGPRLSNESFCRSQRNAWRRHFGQ